MSNGNENIQQTLYITFDRHQVAVRSKESEVLAGVELSFRQMLTTDAKDVVAQLEVWGKEKRYWLRDNDKLEAEGRTLNEVLGLLKYQVALHLIESRPDLLWLHAGAVAYQDNIILISGISGRGKSTTVTNLCAKGWRYLSDDIAPLDQRSNQVIPFPQTPMVRIKQEQEIPHHWVHDLEKAEFPLIPEMVCKKRLAVKAIIFPEFTFGENDKLEKCSPAVAAVTLIQNSLNYVDHREEAVSYLVELVKRVPAYQLFFSEGTNGAEVVTGACQEGRLFSDLNFVKVI